MNILFDNLGNDIYAPGRITKASWKLLELENNGFNYGDACFYGNDTSVRLQGQQGIYLQLPFLYFTSPYSTVLSKSSNSFPKPGSLLILSTICDFAQV